VEEENNVSMNSVITIFRREQLCRITSGAVSTIAPITHVSFGIGGTNANGDPIRPSETQKALNNQIAIYPISSITYPHEPNTVARYNVTIPAADLPGARISEAGLVDADGNLHAIQNFYDKGKDPGVPFSFAFDDKF